MRASKVLALAAMACASGLAAMAAPAPHAAPSPAPAKAAAPATSGGNVPPGNYAPGKAPQPAGASPQGPPPLVVAWPADAPKDALQYLLKPYADATGTALARRDSDGSGLDAPKPGAPDPAPPDLVLLNGAQLLVGCKSNQLSKLDWNTLGRDHYLPQAASDCGAGAYVAATALAWDRDKLPATPNWGDFWDVARHPGGRGLQRTARGNLEIALLADGVSPGDVYRTLRTNDGLDRAFRKLDQLKPYIIWWDKPGEPAEFLSGGRVLLTSAPTASLLQNSDVTHRHYGLQWSGSLVELFSWAVPQAAPHPAVAAASLLIAGDIARQAIFAKATDLGPTVKQALDLLPPLVKAGSPSTPANAQGGLAIDEGFWLEKQDKLQARFSAWAAK
jgi:putative spermidine/putrescine transport system substrate-binding protein